jgi:hypothetical protein
MKTPPMKFQFECICLHSFSTSFRSLIRNSVLLALVLFFSINTKAQTTLAAGDIAVIGFNSSFNISGSAPIGPDEFAIVTLVDISAGTDIKITDHGWAGTVMISGTVQDGIMLWTTTAAIPKGMVFKFTITTGATPSLTISPNTYGTPAITARWITGIAVGAFSNAGDQIIIYQGGTDDNPGTFIYGFNSSSSTAASAGDWQPSAGAMVDSKLPPGLTNNILLDGTVAATAIAFTNNSGGYFANNFVYTGTKAGSKNILLSAIANRANWTYTTTLTTTYDLSVGGSIFSGSNPIFSMGTLPVHIISFSGTKTDAGQKLEWQTANEESFSRYEIEQSSDGKLFSVIGNVAANGNNHYQFLAASMSSRSYYRLKLVDIDGRFIYSRTILLLGQKEKNSIQVYPNPSTDVLTVSSRNTIRQITVLNSGGKTVLSVTGKGTNTENIFVKALPAGMYLVRVKTQEGMEQQKFLKQ